jgi:hypothetical protein
MDSEVVDCQETSSQLASLRYFVLDLPRRVPERSEVVKALLDASSEVFVWPQPKSVKSRPFPTEFVKPERGRYRIDVGKVAFAGFGSFWHLADRGSIAMRMPAPPDNLGSIMSRCPLSPGCTSPSFMSRRSLKRTTSPGAIRYCEHVVDRGEFAFVYPSCISVLSVFAAPADLRLLYHLAESNCRPWNVNNRYFTIEQCWLHARPLAVSDADTRTDRRMAAGGD